MPCTLLHVYALHGNTILCSSASTQLHLQESIPCAQQRVNGLTHIWTCSASWKPGPPNAAMHAGCATDAPVSHRLATLCWMSSYPPAHSRPPPRSASLSHAPLHVMATMSHAPAHRHTCTHTCTHRHSHMNVHRHQPSLCQPDLAHTHTHTHSDTHPMGVRFRHVRCQPREHALQTPQPLASSLAAVLEVGQQKLHRAALRAAAHAGTLLQGGGGMRSGGRRRSIRRGHGGWMWSL